MSNIDYSQLTCGDDYYKLSNGLLLKHYSLSEIRSMGEYVYYLIIQYLTASPSELMIELFDKGIDFREIDDFDLFINNNMEDGIVNNTTLKCFIKDSNFEYVESENSKYFKDKNTGLIINKDIHFEMSELLRKMNGLPNPIENAYNPVDRSTFEYIVQKEKRKREIRKMRISQGLLNPNKGSIFYTIVPAIVNNGENGITYFNFKDLKIYQAIEAFEMLTKRVNFDFTMYGIYSGTINYNKSETPTFLK